jgi:hypothetical protein
MKISLAWLLCLFVAPCWGQSHSASLAKAQTSGCGSPVVTGSGNKFTITCQGIPNALRSQIVDLLNKIAKDQANADEMMNKLNSCIEGVQQVREQQQPWRLTDDQKRKLKEMLNGTKADVAIYAFMSDNNSTLLAEDLVGVLQSVGWDFNMHDIYYDPGVFPPPDQTGVHFLVADQYRLTQSLSPAAHLLLQSLLDVGVQAQWSTVSDESLLSLTSFGKRDLGSVIVIAIGSKPSTSPNP